MWWLAGLMMLSGTVMADERTAIEALLEAKEAAWAAADGEAWAQDYRVDSEVINVHGMRFEGREENARRHREVLAGPFAGTTLVVDVERVKLLGERHALAEAKLNITGIDAMPAGLPDTGDGRLTTHMSFVMEKDPARGWEILFGHNTAVRSPGEH
ncbi:MAG: SgcJ/EcaC family oxidoreductase [Pseudomonadota bacterium]